MNGIKYTLKVAAVFYLVRKMGIERSGRKLKKDFVREIEAYAYSLFVERKRITGYDT